MTSVMKHTIDASGQSLGRVAQAAAVILMGKNDPSYVANKVANVKVAIVNASKLKISEKKKTTVFYERYSGYPGGLTKERMDMRAGRRGYRVLLEDAVYGMIPSNKLRARIMKNLTVTE
mgnify:CR=1 FL=1